jgi:hypothetical protein
MKFRKILTTALALCCLTACNSRPKNISDEMYNYAESVIRAVDAYMDNQLPFETAYTKITGLKGDADKCSDDKSYSKNFSAYHEIALIYMTIYEEYMGWSTYADLAGRRNELAEEIGYPTRD